MIGLICGVVTGIIGSKYYWYRIEQKEWDFIMKPLTRKKPSAAEYYYAMRDENV